MAKINLLSEPDSMSDFDKFEFAHDRKARDVFTLPPEGLAFGEGPGIVVMAEMPGITPSVVNFCRELSKRGYSVYLPHLFGVPGAAASGGAFAKALVPACVSREFSSWSTNKTSPIIEWLKALCRHAKAQCGGPGVGAIGMCFTGGFALAMMVDDSLIAPVMSQPSLPLGPSKRAKASLGLSDSDLACVKARVDKGDKVLALRFTSDRLVAPQRFTSLRRELGEGVITVEIESPDDRWGIRKVAHSVTTDEVDRARALVGGDGVSPEHPVLRAFDTVMEFFAARLKP